jgi:hypothetical protein
MIFFTSDYGYSAFLRTFIDPRRERLIADMRPSRKRVKEFVESLPPGREVTALNLNGGGRIPITDTLLTRHVYIQGSIGSGKTTLIRALLRGLLPSAHASGSDKVVIFDPKGDYLHLVREMGLPHIVVSEDVRLNPVRWNIFREILAGATVKLRRENTVLQLLGKVKQVTPYESFITDNKEVYQRLRKLASSIVHTRANMVESNKGDPYFSHNAPTSVLQGVLACAIIDAATIERGGQGFLKEWGVRGTGDLDNSILLRLSLLPSRRLHFFLSAYGANEAAEHVAPSAPAQSQGVLSSFRMYISDIFTLAFAEKGEWSIAEELHKQEFKAILLEYRLDNEKVAIPVFSAILSNMMDEVLSTRLKGRNLYVVLDELHALPKIESFHTFLNMARDLGGKVIAATQSVAQLYDKYGEQEAKAIISAFNTRIFLRTTDEASLKLVNDTVGELLVRKIHRTVGKEGRSESQEVDRRTLTARTMSVLKPGSGILWTTGAHPIYTSFHP